MVAAILVDFSAEKAAQQVNAPTVDSVKVWLVDVVEAAVEPARVTPLVLEAVVATRVEELEETAVLPVAVEEALTTLGQIKATRVAIILVTER